VATTLNGLALAQEARGNRAEAETLLARAAAIYDGPAGDLPESRPAHAEILKNLAKVYREAGKADQATAAEARAAALTRSP
jgi:hypothetical protein